MKYSIFVSNHLNATDKLPSEAASKSWHPVYDGMIHTNKDARKAIEELKKGYRHIRLFKGNTTRGELSYQV